MGVTICIAIYLLTEVAVQEAITVLKDLGTAATTAFAGAAKHRIARGNWTSFGVGAAGHLAMHAQTALTQADEAMELLVHMPGLILKVKSSQLQGF